MQAFIKQAVIAAAAIAALSSAQAANYTFSGNIANHNDVVQITFSLASAATNVAVWTDSHLGGANFDPITALWVKQGNDYRLIDSDDDNPTISPSTQTFYDSGFSLPSLAAGDYLFTVATFSNDAKGQFLSQGFEYDGQTPMPIASWDQPAKPANYGYGTFWRVNLSGVDVAAPPPVAAIPEPSTYALMGLGLGVMGFIARRRRSV